MPPVPVLGGLAMKMPRKWWFGVTAGSVAGARRPPEAPTHNGGPDLPAPPLAGPRRFGVKLFWGFDHEPCRRFDARVRDRRPRIQILPATTSPGAGRVRGAVAPGQGPAQQRGPLPRLAPPQVPRGAHGEPAGATTGAPGRSGRLCHGRGRRDGRRGRRRVGQHACALRRGGPDAPSHQLAHDIRRAHGPRSGREARDVLPPHGPRLD